MLPAVSRASRVRPGAIAEGLHRRAARMMSNLVPLWGVRGVHKAAGGFQGGFGAPAFTLTVGCTAPKISPAESTV